MYPLCRTLSMNVCATLYVCAFSFTMTLREITFLKTLNWIIQCSLYTFDALSLTPVLLDTRILRAPFNSPWLYRYSCCWLEVLICFIIEYLNVFHVTALIPPSHRKILTLILDLW